MQFYFPTKIEINGGIASSLGKVSCQYGDKALLVTGRHFLSKTGLLDSTINDLVKNDVEVTHFSDVSSNPNDQSINDAIGLATKKKCNLVIGFGGGSAIDTAKMVSVCLGETSNSWDFFRDPQRPAKPIKHRSIPLIALPTTSGTGSESSPFAVIKNREQNLKKGISSNFLYPDVSLIDPEILTYLPKHLTAWTGCDALGQALESYTSSKSNSLSDVFAFQALRLLIEHLPKAYKDGQNLFHREQVALGAMLSGIAISFTETNLAHALAEALGGEHDLHHGLTVGLFTPIAIKHNLENAKGGKTKNLVNKYSRVASLIDNSTPQTNQPNALLAETCSKTVQTFLSNLDIPKKVSELGLTDINTEKLADLAIDMGSIKSNIVPIEKIDAIKLFRCVT